MEIDGSIGGGSVLRIAVPLAVAHGIPITVTNIRKHRKKPGLRLQHLLGLQLLQKISSAQVTGLTVGSETITFVPNELSMHQHYTLNVDTAASLSLIIQTLQNYVIASSQSVDVQFNGGGTHVNWSPTAEFIQHVTAPYLSFFGITLNYVVERAGFFPRGGARAFCSLNKRPVNHPIQLTEFTKPITTYAYATVSTKLRNRQVAERMLHLFSTAITTVNYVDTDAGAALTAFGGTLPRGVSLVGEKRMSSESIGKQVKEDLDKQFYMHALDAYMSDQILVPLAYAPSGSVVHVQDTEHVRTNLDVLDYFFTNLWGHPVLDVTSIKHYLQIRKI